MNCTICVTFNDRTLKYSVGVDCKNHVIILNFMFYVYFISVVYLQWNIYTSFGQSDMKIVHLSNILFIRRRQGIMNTNTLTQIKLKLHSPTGIIAALLILLS